MAAVASLLASVLAHQGGWDEILFVLAPLAIFAWLLHLARKRADQLPHDGAGEGAAAGAGQDEREPR